ncbi:unnamed protein product [Notodromas monacha]|uniref:Armadillo-like helical domain-containing protein n=1 Tax=Notodromas monacha TaxID=399045 RepID=A0A7R9BFL1_9CRUS|nr:unnamed protein product [Notodromas monacha]CAG0914518.1 unnamed protein product [Notodromas monacha]
MDRLRYSATPVIRKSFKEKIVQYYEALFRGEDPSIGNASFWDEFFLLKPKISFFESEIGKFSGEQLVSSKPILNRIFSRCVSTLEIDQALPQNQFRTINAVITLSGLIHSVNLKTSLNHGFDTVDLLMGFQESEGLMKTLLDKINEFLAVVLTSVRAVQHFSTGDYHSCLKSSCLKLLLTIALGTDNVSQNTLLEFLMMNPVHEVIIHILSCVAWRQQFGHECVLLLTLLVNYRKFESVNPYGVKLSILSDELALHGYGQVVGSSLGEFIQRYAVHVQDGAGGAASNAAGGGLFSAISSVVGSFFAGEETEKTACIRANIGMLLALYEAVHLNRNFIAVITQLQADLVPVGNDEPSASLPDTGMSSELPLPPPAEVHMSKEARSASQASGRTMSTGESALENSGNQKKSDTDQPSNSCETTNLLVAFLEYSSIVMQETKMESRCDTVKLCFMILACVAEDQYANSLMHDPNFVFSCVLHRMPMRHRKVPVHMKSPSRPLACALLDLMIEFIVSHMFKRFPLDLYNQGLGIIHRLVCYQRRARVRLGYSWHHLWSALISLLKFIQANENGLVKKMNVFPLCLKAISIFNLFITHGDTFLAAPTAYDDLYYELIRMRQVFENLYAMALRYSTTPHGASSTEWRESALKLSNALVNIRGIINHFTPRIEAVSQANGGAALTEEQVLDVVRQNYDSLTLKLQESLDQYERYSEKPHQAFFTQMVRSFVCDTRQSLSLASVDQSRLLRDA